jgi:hypothetical protein
MAIHASPCVASPPSVTLASNLIESPTIRIRRKSFALISSEFLIESPLPRSRRSLRFRALVVNDARKPRQTVNPIQAIFAVTRRKHSSEPDPDRQLFRQILRGALALFPNRRSCTSSHHRYSYLIRREQLAANSLCRTLEP